MCPYCNQEKSNLIIIVKGYKVVSCTNCFLVYTKNFKINSKKINFEVYDKKYVENYELRKSFIKFGFVQKLQILEKYKHGGTLLDVGCSLGYFLQVVAAASRYKWKLFGSEMNSKLGKIAAKQSNAQVSTESLPKLGYINQQFDVVTCFDVLEHSQHIRKNISEINRILKDDGVLLVQCPNYRSLMQYLTGDKWDWWAPPDHILHFSPQTLSRVLEENGFRIVYKKTYEHQVDFLSNIKGALFKTRIMKFLYYLLVPIFVLNEKIAALLGYGGLILIVAKKK